MFDWNSSKSVKLSSMLLKIVFVLLVGVAALLPMIIRWYNPQVETTEFIVSLVTLYLVVAFGFVAAVYLHAMLRNINKGDVFIHKNTASLRVLSYCCFAIAVLFIVLGFYLPVALLVAAAAGFVGLILRVVKNVFARAVELREENDTTI